VDVVAEDGNELRWLTSTAAGASLPVGLEGALEAIRAIGGGAGLTGERLRGLVDSTRAVLTWLARRAASRAPHGHVEVVREDQDLYVRSAVPTALDGDADIDPGGVLAGVRPMRGGSLDVAVERGRIVCVLQVPLPVGRHLTARNRRRAQAAQTHGRAAGIFSRRARRDPGAGAPG
jgi:hypothetical protein